MIHLTAETAIVVATEAVDFRMQIDGLVARCQSHLQHNARDGKLYLFINRRATMIRILAYDKNGYILMTKRLSRGHFKGWPRAGEAVSRLQAVQLRQLLAGALA